MTPDTWFTSTDSRDSTDSTDTDRDRARASMDSSRTITIPDPLSRVPSTENRSQSRGQVVMLGLLFAITTLVILYVLFQTYGGQAVRQETESNHALTTLEDMQGIQVDMVAAAESGATQGSVIKMGTQYPFRAFLIHPQNPAGTIQTTDRTQLVVDNAIARDNETADYIDGNELAITSSGVSYSPDYAEYRSAPDLHVTAAGVLYSQYENTRSVINEPSIVDGREISLTSTVGDLFSNTGLPLRFRVTPLSASPTTVRVTNQSAGTPVTVSVDTELNESTWRQMLGEQIDSDTSISNPQSDSDSQYVAGIQKSGGTLDIVFETGETYQLHTSKLGIVRASEPALNQTRDPSVTYLTTESDADPAVPENNTVELTVEVRDALNNPVGDVKIEASAPSGDIDRRAKLSGTDGEVTFEYTTPEIIANTDVKDSETYQVTTQISSGSGEQVVVVFDVQVQNTHN